MPKCDSKFINTSNCNEEAAAKFIVSFPSGDKEIQHFCPKHAVVYKEVYERNDITVDIGCRSREAAQEIAKWIARFDPHDFSFREA